MGKPSNAKTQDSYTVNFLPNELDRFDSSTYHFRLYMMPIEDFTRKNWFDRSRQITIAESGVTAYGINDVDIQSVIAPTAFSGLGKSTAIDFNIVEPHGARLLDNLYNAANEMGIQNYLKCPYFLELSFVGRQESSSEPSKYDRYWTWPLQIISAEMSMNASGSIYEFKTVPMIETAYSNQVADLDKNVTIDGDNVKDILYNLAEKLNQKELDKIKNDQIYTDMWEFKFHGEYENAKLKIVADETSTSPSKKSAVTTKEQKVRDKPNSATKKQDDITKKTTQFNQNESIMSIIDSLMISTKEIKSALKVLTPSVASSEESSEAKEESATEKSGEKDKGLLKQIYRVYTDVEILAYDPLRNDYQKKYIYHIVPYKTTQIISSESEVKSSKEISNKNWNDLISERLLAKHYNYIFTGLNDQVLDFDLRFNFLWYSALPLQSGQAGITFLDSGRRLPAQLTTVYDDHLKTIAKLKYKDSKFSSTTTGYTATEQSIKNKIEASRRRNQISAEEAETLVKLLENKRTARIFEVSIRDRNFTNRLVQDITQRSSTVFPVTVVESSKQAGGNQTGVEDTADTDRTFVSAMFSQLHEDRNSDMLALDLEVKGDPYWIADKAYSYGISRAFSVEDLINEQIQANVTSELKDKTNGAYFLFTSQSPNVDSIHDNKSFSKNTVINGVYHVTQITHKFNEGKFTQTLKAVRHKAIDLNHIQTNSFNFNPSTTRSQYESQQASEKLSSRANQTNKTQGL